jgi:hypothetical protein
MLRRRLHAAITISVFVALAVISLIVLCTEAYEDSGIVTLEVRHDFFSFSASLPRKLTPTTSTVQFHECACRCASVVSTCTPEPRPARGPPGWSQERPGSGCNQSRRCRHSGRKRDKLCGCYCPEHRRLCPSELLAGHEALLHRLQARRELLRAAAQSYQPLACEFTGAARSCGERYT